MPLPLDRSEVTLPTCKLYNRQFEEITSYHFRPQSGQRPLADLRAWPPQACQSLTLDCGPRARMDGTAMRVKRSYRYSLEELPFRRAKGMR